jgi:hypothetical protein
MMKTRTLCGKKYSPDQRSNATNILTGHECQGCQDAMFKSMRLSPNRPDLTQYKTHLVRDEKIVCREKFALKFTSQLSRVTCERCRAINSN